MSAPFASIIVPTYNQAEYIGAALDSILAQTDPSWEAIIVNDGSTDGTAAIIEAYSARDARFKVFHKPNGGVASALNEGLARATGRWIHWLSSDDLFEPAKLALNRRWIERHPDTKFFFSYFTLLRETTGQREKRELWGPVPDPEHQILTLLYRNPISGITICIDREAWLEVGGFDVRFYYAQDYHQWLRLLQKHQAMFIPEWTAINRNHANQGSEIFPDACYFDTAKAGIAFLNRYRFPELVPHVDLSDPDRAKAAVAAALTFASDQTSFIYALGPTPALLLRVLEWAFGENAHQEIRDFLRDEIVTQALKSADDSFAWMWRTLAAAVTQPDPRFVYDPSDHIRLARTLHAGLVGKSQERAAALRRYLRRFDQVEIAENGTDAAVQYNVAICAEAGAAHETIQALAYCAEALAARGHRLVIVRPQPESYRWVDGVIYIRSPAHELEVFAWLSDVTVAVDVGVQNSGCSRATRRIQISPSDVSLLEETVLRQIARLAEPAGDEPRRTIVFLQRVLRGGGAERVVRDLVRGLDRKKYRPFVATLYDSEPDPDYPADVPVLNVRRFLQEQISVPDGSPVPTATPTTAASAAIPGGADPVIRSFSERLKGEIKTRIKRVPAAATAAYKARRLANAAMAEAARQRRAGVRRLLSLGRAFANRLDPQRLAATATEMIANAQQPASAMREFTTRHSAFFAMAEHHWTAAEGLRRLMSHLGPNTTLIPVMEEAVVAAWMAQQGGRIPYVASLHILESRYLNTMYPEPIRYQFEKWAFGNACRNADAIIFPSTGCANDLVSFADVEERALRVIPNPVDCALVRRLAFAPAKRVRRNSAEKLFVSIGRLDPQKGQDLLLHAFARVRATEPGARLIIIGEGQELQSLLALRAALGLEQHVELLGALDNPFPVLRECDSLVLSSRFESFALVLLEAMVCGVPIVSFDCPFGPAEVLADGHFGLLVPPEDVPALADAMVRIVNDGGLRGSLVSRGYKRALEYDVHKIASSWEEVVHGS